MLKMISIRKIAVTTTALVIICMLYFFPTKPETINLKQNNITTSSNAKVFLIDKNDYVSLVDVNLKNKDLIKKISEIINLLTITDKRNKNIPKNFNAIIPKNTKVKKIDFKEGTVYLDFSSELKNTNNLDKVIESIVYSLTEIDEVKGVKITVENKVISNKYNRVLTRDIGINKEVDISSPKGITKTTVYYLNNEEDNIYYIPVTKVTNDKREKIAVIIDELKSSVAYQSNLSSFLSSNAELEEYKIEEDVMHLTFNDKIFDDFKNKNILEEVKYTIGKSIEDNYGVEEVIFYVNGKEIAKTNSKTLEN